MIYVNLITAVIKTLVAYKNNEAFTFLHVFVLQLYDLLLRLNGLAHVLVFLCVTLRAAAAGLKS